MTTTPRTGSGPFAWANLDREPDPFAIEPAAQAARSGHSVDGRTGHDLASALRSLADAVAEPGIDRPERLARLELLARSAGDLATAGRLLDPYADGQRSRIGDELTFHAAASTPAEREQAAHRIAAHRQVRALAWADLAGLSGKVVAGTTTVPGVDGLLAIATPAPALAPQHLTEIPVIVGPLPEAHIDPAIGVELDSTAFTVDGAGIPLHVSAFGLNIAAQLADWGHGGLTEVDRIVTAIVDRGLESAILADLADGAVASTSLAAAESEALAAWSSTSRAIIVAAPADLPTIRAEYVGVPETYWPRILLSSAQTVGTAHVFAESSVLVEASDLETMAADDPRLFGRQLTIIRYGRAVPRATGVVRTVTL